MRALATYDGGDIVAEFEANAAFETSEIVGRPGEWIADGDVEITRLEILGVTLDAGLLDGSLVNAILALSDDLEWRFEREDAE